MNAIPDVSVILPVRNEEEHIDEAMSDLLSQQFDGELELVVADGRSTDRTPEKVAAWAERDDRVVLVDNEGVHQAHGLNRGAEVARAPVLLRADGHTRYADDYVAASLAAQTEMGGAVGGRMNPVGRTSIGRAVAAAMNSPFTMGPARFHHSTTREEVDTVYLGCFPRDDFLEIGGFRHFPSGSSEDADFYYRWRKSGRKVFIDPAIRTEYSPRRDVAGLRRQYWRYGKGKSEMLWANGRFPSWRPIVPMSFLAGIISTLVLALTATAWPLLLLLTAWLGLLAVVAISSGESVPKVMAAAAIMHLSYSLGAWAGLLSGPGPVRQLRE